MASISFLSIPLTTSVFRFVPDPNTEELREPVFSIDVEILFDFSRKIALDLLVLLGILLLEKPNMEEVATDC